MAELTISADIINRVLQPTPEELAQEEFVASKTSCFSDLSEYPVLGHLTSLRTEIAEAEQEVEQLKEKALNEALTALVMQDKQTGLVFDNDDVKIMVRMVVPKVTPKNSHQFPDLHYHLEMAEVERQKTASEKRSELEYIEFQIEELKKGIAVLETSKASLLEASEEYLYHITEAAKLIREIQGAKTPQLAIQIKGVK